MVYQIPRQVLAIERNRFKQDFDRFSIVIFFFLLVSKQLNETVLREQLNSCEMDTT